MLAAPKKYHWSLLFYYRFRHIAAVHVLPL